MPEAMAPLYDPEIRLVIFDCDGVLIDSEILSGQILIELLGEIGVQVDFDFVQRNFLGRSFTKVAAEIRESFGTKLAPDFEERYRAQLAAVFKTGLKPIPGIERILGEIGVRYCMATSSSPARAKMSLELSGLAHYFGDRYFTASQVARGKPAPDLFLYAASAMEVAPENCLVIEDSDPGIDAAIAAGMLAFRFTGGSHMRNGQKAGGNAMPNVVEFNDWREFYRIAPQLRRQTAPAGHADVR
jgi:HAD superfamily hydrolase (TIGR01509 family)